MWAILLLKNTLDFIVFGVIIIGGAGITYGVLQILNSFLI